MGTSFLIQKNVKGAIYKKEKELFFLLHLQIPHLPVNRSSFKNKTNLLYILQDTS